MPRHAGFQHCHRDNFRDTDIVDAVNLKGAASCETYRHRLNIIGNRVSRIQDDLQILESKRYKQCG